MFLWVWINNWIYKYENWKNNLSNVSIFNFTKILKIILKVIKIKVTHIFSIQISNIKKIYQKISYIHQYNFESSLHIKQHIIIHNDKYKQHQ
jgi:hypothetical protein